MGGIRNRRDEKWEKKEWEKKEWEKKEWEKQGIGEIRDVWNVRTERTI
jgi:hypothetical protein